MEKFIEINKDLQIFIREIDIPPKLPDYITKNIDTKRGILLASDYEYPDRYSRYDIGFINPPIEFRGKSKNFEFLGLNGRGKIILPFFYDLLNSKEFIEEIYLENNRVYGKVKPMAKFFSEEERSKQPSLFSIVKELINIFKKVNEKFFGLYGAFGYDLVFQFEPIKFKHSRENSPYDIRLFLPDDIYLIDHQKQEGKNLKIEFQYKGNATFYFPRETETIEIIKRDTIDIEECDHKDGEFAKKVEIIRQRAKKGDFFEVVLSQTFYRPFKFDYTEIFRRLRESNPSPYEFLINFGDEALIGASPEMFIRVENNIVETSPISGTIKRGNDPIEDSEQILKLLNSEKDKDELTMCTDVDRNDKSRVCKPETIIVKHRRIIETYSKLFHTVDHVVGELKEGYDSIDAFLSHMWAVTLTGAPKPIAMETIEEMENSPRGYYGGAIGFISFTGYINTGITIRTIYVKNGIASVRAGATLLYYSDPNSEEKETKLKASAFLEILNDNYTPPQRYTPYITNSGKNKKVLFIDNKDSFVLTLAGYVRRTGAEVLTYRLENFDISKIKDINPNLIFLSPGPMSPSEMGLTNFVKEVIKRYDDIPIFGVCLGHQAIVEAFGGKLGILEHPYHGKQVEITHFNNSNIFKGIPQKFKAGLYHSLYALESELPKDLIITSKSELNVIMSVKHKSLKIESIQFHPESILSLNKELGMKIIENLLYFI